MNVLSSFCAIIDLNFLWKNNKIFLSFFLSLALPPNPCFNGNCVVAPSYEVCMKYEALKSKVSKGKCVSACLK